MMSCRRTIPSLNVHRWPRHFLAFTPKRLSLITPVGVLAGRRLVVVVSRVDARVPPAPRYETPFVRPVAERRVVGPGAVGHAFQRARLPRFQRTANALVRAERVRIAGARQVADRVVGHGFVLGSVQALERGLGVREPLDRRVRPERRPLPGNLIWFN